MIMTIMIICYSSLVMMIEVAYILVPQSSFSSLDYDEVDNNNDNDYAEDDYVS